MNLQVLGGLYQSLQTLAAVFATRFGSDYIEHFFSLEWPISKVHKNFQLNLVKY